MHLEKRTTKLALLGCRSIDTLLFFFHICSHCSSKIKILCTGFLCERLSDSGRIINGFQTKKFGMHWNSLPKLICCRTKFYWNNNLKSFKTPLPSPFCFFSSIQYDQFNIREYSHRPVNKGKNKIIEIMGIKIWVIFLYNNKYKSHEMCAGNFISSVDNIT